MPADDETLRTFIALPLPEEWGQALATVIDGLRDAAPRGVRWVDPKGTHLTLRFLGATKSSLAPRIVEGLQTEFAGAVSPTLQLSRLGTFPAGGNPRVLWAGVAGEMDLLTDLYERAQSVVCDLGWPRETRPFRPHLTIGRVRDRVAATQRRAIADAVDASDVPTVPRWTANRVRLYRSELTPNGAIYSNLGEVEI